MGTTKLKVEGYAPLVSKIERRIIATATWLTMAGRATLVDTAISSIPIYPMCTVKMHITVLNAIDRARRHGLWRGSDVAGKGKPLVAWSKVTMPKEKGGLGLKNLQIMNEALLMKHLHKFYNKANVPWVQLIWNTHYANGQIPHATTDRGSFWWKDVLKFCDHYRGIAAAKVGRGDTVLLWLDVWNGEYLKGKFPRLFSFAKNQKISVAQYISNQDIQHNFHLPLSHQAMQELHSFNQIISQVQQQQDKDHWTYIWGNGIYTSKKFYVLNFKSIVPPTPFKWI